MPESANIRFEPAGRTVTVPVGSTLLEAARAAGLTIDAPCGGTGTCGSCQVHAEGVLEALTPDEREMLGGASIAAGRRLACRARVAGDAVVTLAEAPAEARVVTSAEVRPLEVEPPSARGIDALGTLAGAAIDIGTTTLAVQLLDLKTGEVLATVGERNSQRAFGADVLSRVAHATAGGGPELQALIAAQLESMLAEALDQAGLATDHLLEATVAGNTAMTGLLLGADVSPLGEAPYEGAPTGGARVPAHQIGLAAFPSLDVLVLPGASAFVGSDITAGLLAVDLAERTEPTLLIDLGTNGELVLAWGGEIVAASTAAGPALEGASIECGMRAEAGAIERATFEDGVLTLGVIGDREPTGICGSGLLDLVAAMLDAGALDASGRMLDGEGPLRDRVVERHGVRAFVADEAAGIVVTQKDVREVQLAVGAVRTGLDLLLEEARIAPEAVAGVIVAGGFGYHVRAASLARLGLIPPLWQDRVTFGGNTSLAGARMALVSTAARERASVLAAAVRTVDLAAHPRFRERFLSALHFPE